MCWLFHVTWFLLSCKLQYTLRPSAVVVLQYSRAQDNSSLYLQLVTHCQSSWDSFQLPVFNWRLWYMTSYKASRKVQPSQCGDNCIICGHPWASQGHRSFNSINIFIFLLYSYTYACAQTPVTMLMHVQLGVAKNRTGIWDLSPNFFSIEKMVAEF